MEQRRRPGVRGGDHVDSARTDPAARCSIITGAEPLDIAFGSGKTTFERINHVPVFYGWRDNMQHIGTYGAADGGELGQIAWKWLEWTTRGDQVAAKAFVGPTCSLCRDPAWHISKKQVEADKGRASR